VGFFQDLAGLDGYGSVYVGLGEFVDEVCGQEIAAECGHAVVDPAVFGGGVLPEMMVGVDDWGDCGGLGVHAVTMLLASGLWGNCVAVYRVVCFGDGRFGIGRICS
jgi:hypothetical protein